MVIYSKRGFIWGNYFIVLFELVMESSFAGYFGRKSTERPCRPHHICRAHVIPMPYHCWCFTLDHLAEMVIVKFLHCKVSPSPPFLTFERTHYVQPTLRSAELCFTSLKRQYLYRLFRIMLYIPPFICLFDNLLYQYGHVNIYWYFGL